MNVSLSEKWEKLIIFVVFLSGAFLVAGGLYLSQVPVGNAPQERQTEASADKVEAVALYSEEWCDIMVEKPNAQWQGDDFILFSQHCLNPPMDSKTVESTASDNDLSAPSE